jgi:hypothetical protein
VFDRRDRWELAFLGLVVLAWGLLVAPIVHSFEHGHRHTHGLPSDPSRHAGEGTVEHLLAIGVETQILEAPVARVLVVRLVEPRSPESAAVRRWNSVEQPQGP